MLIQTDGSVQNLFFLVLFVADACVRIPPKRPKYRITVVFACYGTRSSSQRKSYIIKFYQIEQRDCQNSNSFVPRRLDLIRAFVRWSSENIARLLTAESCGSLDSQEFTPEF